MWRLFLIIVLILNMILILYQRHIIKILENKLQQAYNDAIKELNKNRNGE